MAIALDTSAGGRAEAFLTNTSNSTITVNKPANVVDGDLMLAIVGNQPDGADATSEITAPAGWTRAGHTLLSRWGVPTGAFYKFASSEGSNYTFALPMNNTQADFAVILRITGADTSAVLAAFPRMGFGDAATIPLGSITTLSNNALVIGLVAAGDGYAGTSSVKPTDMTLLYEASSHFNSSGVRVGVAYMTKTSAGPTGNQTWTSFKDADTYSGTVLIAIHAAGESQTTTYRDNFTGTAGVNLETHDPSWYKMRTGTALLLGSGGTSLTTPASSNSSAYEYRGLNRTVTDCEVSCKVNSLNRGTDSTFEYHLILRSDGTGNNYYDCLIGDATTGAVTNGVKIRKRSGGTMSDLTSVVNSAFVDGDTVTFRAVGTTLSVLVNGTQVLSYTDSSFASGAMGLSYYRSGANATGELDWWEGNPTYVSIVKKLKLLVKSTAQSVSNVAGIVFTYPTGGNVVGTEIGEFTGKSFESSLENGQAVLKVPVADFGGSSLTTSDTPVVLVRTSTNTTGVVPAQVIEE